MNTIEVGTFGDMSPEDANKVPGHARGSERKTLKLFTRRCEVKVGVLGTCPRMSPVQVHR